MSWPNEQCTPRRYHQNERKRIVKRDLQGVAEYIPVVMGTVLLVVVVVTVLPLMLTELQC